MSSLQTARTLEPGQSEYAVSVGSYTSEAITDSLRKEGEVKGEKLSLPFMEVSYRQGLSKSIDGGLKLSLSGAAMLDGKYSLIEGEKFATSIGAGLGYFSIESESGGVKSSTTVMDFVIPLIVSYDFTQTFSLYGAPKYVLRNISGNGSGSTQLAGGTVGVKVGKTWGGYFEASQLKDTKSEFTLSQANVALFWETKPWF